MPFRKQANKIVPPTADDLQHLFDLPSDTQTQGSSPENIWIQTLEDGPARAARFLAELENPQFEKIHLDGSPLNPCELSFDKGKKQQEMLVAAIPEAIRELRMRLDKSQWEMTLLLGCTPSTYKSWERGKSTPSGAWILMLLRMCPDAETLANFGLKLSSE